MEEIDELTILQEKNKKLENELIQMKIKMSKLNFKHFYQTHKICIKKITNDNNCKHKINLDIDYGIEDIHSIKDFNSHNG